MPRSSTALHKSRLLYHPDEGDPLEGVHMNTVMLSRDSSPWIKGLARRATRSLVFEGLLKTDGRVSLSNMERIGYASEEFPRPCRGRTPVTPVMKSSVSQVPLKYTL